MHPPTFSTVLWRFLALIAFLGLGASLVVHLATFWDIDVAKDVPLVWLLHLGIFVVWLPMIVVLKARKVSADAFGQLSWIPAWGRTLSILLFLYTLLNFALFMATAPPKPPQVINGQYTIYRHGFTQPITAQEYHQIQSRTLRGFSGHWMLFYLIAALNLFYLPPAELPEGDREDGFHDQ